MRRIRVSEGKGLKCLKDCADIRMSGLMIFRTVLSIVSLVLVLMGSARMVELP